MMSTPKESALARLELFRTDRFRAARWRAIDQARQLGVKWDDIAERMGVTRPVVIRMYRNDAPGEDSTE